jgi:hypothetical protein
MPRSQESRPRRALALAASGRIYAEAQASKLDAAEAAVRRHRLAANYSTTSVGLRSTGRDTLWKLGEVAITAWWISANCSLVPLPLMRTT